MDSQRSNLDPRQMVTVTSTSSSAASTSTPSDSTSHLVSIDVTPPIMCQTMNITFDPTLGQPPFDVLIAFENWFVERLSLPSTYSNLDSGLWLLQYPVPSFNNVSGTPFPNMIVSLIDSSGLMSNSSSIQQVAEPKGTSTCPLMTGSVGFVFYVNSAPSECAPLEVTWTGSVVAPMTLYLLPENHPPISIVNSTAISPETGSSTLSPPLKLKAGTRFLTLLDDESSSGGVSSLNVVGLSGDDDPSCILEENDFTTSLPLPSQTIASMSVTPDYTTTQVSRTTSAGRIITVTATETHAGGHIIYSNNVVNKTTIIAAVLGAAAALAIAFLFLYCKKKKSNNKPSNTRWEISGDSTAYGSNPIHPNFFGRGRDDNNASHENLRNQAAPPGMRDGDENRREMDPSFNHSRNNLISPQSNTFTQDSHPSTNTQNPFASHEDGVYDAGMVRNGSRTLVTRQDQIEGRSQSYLSSRSQFSHPLASPSSPPVSPLVHTGKEGFRNGNGSTHRSIEGNGSSANVSIGNSSHLRHRATPSNPINQGSYENWRSDPESTSHSRTRSNHQDPFSPQSDGFSSAPWNEATFQSDSSGTRSYDSNSRMIGRSRAPIIQRHEDAGMLQDDRLDDDEDEEIEDGNGQRTVIDLPPQYEDVHPSRQTNPSTSNQNQHPTSTSMQQQTESQFESDMWFSRGDEVNQNEAMAM